VSARDRLPNAAELASGHEELTAQVAKLEAEIAAVVPRDAKVMAPDTALLREVIGHIERLKSSIQMVSR
jgi:hypothetical protein